VASLRPRARTNDGRRQKRIVWVQDLYSLGITETKQGGPMLERVMHAVESFVLRRADGVAVIHDRFRHHVVGRLGVADHRVRVMRNWTHLAPFADLDDTDRAAIRARHGWGEHETIVLHAGNMGVKQGLENVVAAARLADEQALPMKFVLLGDGARRAALQAEASGIGCLQFIDPVGDHDFAGLLQAADFLLVNELPGMSAMSVPSKLTSYFAAGRPVIAATDAGSVTAGELAASGAGVRVDAGDPGALVAAVGDLAGDPDLARELGAAGRTYREEVLGEAEAIDRYADWVAGLGRAESLAG
jgi:colanic acid biosynthesis glycosyl transferase WcaI